VSDISSFYGDFGVAAAAATRRRKQQSIANTQSAMLGQQRGARNVTNIQKQYQEGFTPLVGSYGRRGFGGPNVSSGIRTQGLEKYAQNLQKDLGTESARLQDELNSISMTDAGQQADLESYLANLRLTKQQQILNSALDIKQMASY
jgi:hypothetical protein